MFKEVKIYRGTTNKDAEEFINCYYHGLSWWSNNRETVEHYYEGSVLEMTILLDDESLQDYISEEDELCIPLSMYNYGFVEVVYPEGAIWYSFSPSYIYHNSIKIKEISLEELKEVLV